MLERHGLIRYHTVERPFAKDSLMHWTHWAAAIKETANGERFAVDSSAGANGENPHGAGRRELLRARRWADNTPPETGLAIARSNGGRLARGTHGLTAMLQRMEALGYADSPAGSSR